MGHWKGTKKRLIQLKKPLICILSTLMIIFSSGCSVNNDSFITYSDTSTEPKITLTFFGNINASEKIAPIENLITAYMKENPDVNIVYEGIDPSLSVNYNSLLSKRLSTGNGDDIFFSYAGYLPTLVKNGYLEPLNDLNSWSQYSEQEKDFLSINGSYYGIPMERTVIGMYCNMDVLNQYGLEVPETYEELLSVCSVLKEKGLTPIAASQLLPFSGYAYADGLSSIYRADNAEETKTRLQEGTESYSTYFLNGFEHLEQMLDAGYIDRDATLSSDTTAQAEKSFANSECAFLLGASDLNASIVKANPSLNYAVYPIPVSNGEGVVLTAPDHLLCINQNSKNKETALDFIEFCTGRKNIETYISKQGSLSPLSGAKAEASYLQPVAKIISEDKAISSVNYNLTARMQNWVQLAGVDLLKGMTPAEAVDELDSLIKGGS